MRPWRQLFGRDWLIEVPYLAVPGYASDRNALEEMQTPG